MIAYRDNDGAIPKKNLEKQEKQFPFKFSIKRPRLWFQKKYLWIIFIL